jgi:ATP-dependent Clp protease, protease subunit
MNKKPTKDMPNGDVIIGEEPKAGADLYELKLNKNRQIFLYTEIDEDSAKAVVTRIKALNMEDNKKPIILELCTPGGSVDSGLAIINAIESSQAPVHTIISGSAASMGAVIFIAGKKRYMYANSSIMFHPMSEGQADYLQFIKDRTKYLIALEKDMENHCKKYTKMDELDYAKMSGGELWLTAKQAKRKGVCDKIL